MPGRVNPDVLTGVLVCSWCDGPFEPDDHGIWNALGPYRAHRTLAQLSNVVPPVPQLYERVWRRRSSALLSGGALTLDGELAALRDTMPAGGVLADIGCSEGLYARTVAATGATVIAVDHSRAFLRRVARHARHLPIAPVRALAQHLPVADAALDGVMIGGSLNEIGDADAAVAEMARVTKPGGRLFSMSVVASETRRGRAVQRLVGPAGIDVPSLEATIARYEAAGFRVDHHRRAGALLLVSATRRAAIASPITSSRADPITSPITS